MTEKQKSVKEVLQEAAEVIYKADLYRAQRQARATLALTEKVDDDYQLVMVSLVRDPPDPTCRLKKES